MLRMLALILGPLALIGQPVRAGTSADEYFEKKVRPLLLEKCISCHGPAKQKGALRLDSRDAAFKGGDTGPAIRPGQPADSLFVKAIRYADDVKMPPKGKLADDEIAILSTWVKEGAAWPNDSAQASGAAPKPKDFDLAGRAKAHWSFQPIARPAVPSVREPHPPLRNPIDAFLLAKLQSVGLGFAPQAERRTLARRLYFDLLGLPPTSEELDAFENDRAPDAYEKLVEKLLANPRYGERWGRHWLDLVRYAETYGHEFDFSIPEAWRYRDYLIRAFNADLPYDQFLREHIAGDLLPKPRRHPEKGWNESVLATGFWFFHEAKHSPVDSRADQADRIDNQIDVFGKSVLGLTLACARCHDHKFDPVSTKDYYALSGILSSSRYRQAFIDDPAPTVALLDELKSARAKWKKLMADAKVQPAPSTNLNPARPSKSVAVWRAASAPFETFDFGWRERWFVDGLGLRAEAESGNSYPHTGRESVKLGAALRSRTFVIDRPILAVRVAGQEAQVRLVLNGLELIRSPIYGGLMRTVKSGPELSWVTFDLKMWQGQRAYLELLDDGPGYFAATEVRWAKVPPPLEAGAVPPPSRFEMPPELAENATAKELLGRIQSLESRIPKPARALAIADGTPRNEHVFVRGSHKTLGDEAPRRNLEVFGSPPFTASGSGRLELARELTSPANPLVARVMINRIWQHHFGEGIVRSPDDFGYQGQRPTHPELLDFLAGEFREHGWSIKHMHRLIVLSSAYQQSSNAEFGMRNAELKDKDPELLDPQNKLLHRQNVRRLEAEAIRDALLAVSGRIDPRMEGPGVLPYLSEHISGRGRPASGPLDGEGRRSIYLQVRRNFLSPMFVAFDYPTPFTTMGRRSSSNVPAQALSMLNNPFVLQQAELWAKRVLAQPDLSEIERVRSMYRAAFGRWPSASEAATASAFLKEQAREYGKPDDSRAWADLAHVLFNTKEFLFVE